MAKSGRLIGHFVNHVLRRYPIVERSGGKKFEVDYNHRVVAHTMGEIHQAGMRAVGSGRDYVAGAAEHVSALARPATSSEPTSYDELRMPSERNAALYKRFGRVPLSRLIKENALTPTEQGALLARSLRNQGIGATVVSTVLMHGHKAILVKFGDGRFVDPRSGEMVDKDLAIMKQTRWNEVYKA